MTKSEKLQQRLLDVERAFTWQELRVLLLQLGYVQHEGAGSRVKFDNGNPDHLLSLHKPHPGNELKRYVRRQLIEKLRSGGLIS